MTEDSNSRTTPIGLYHYAHAYAASAITLVSAKVITTHPDAPVRYLFSHTVELYLKSFLLLNGVRYSELRRQRMGHDLSALLREAMGFHLRVSEEMVAQIDLANKAILDRYIETGFRKVPATESLTDICQHLNDEIGRIVYADAGVKRDIPTLKAGD